MPAGCAGRLAMQLFQYQVVVRDSSHGSLSLTFRAWKYHCSLKIYAFAHVASREKRSDSSN